MTLRRDQKRRVKLNRFNRLDFDCRNHFRKISQDQNEQFQNCDDDAKSIEMQRQESFEKRNQREKRVKNLEELVLFIQVKNVKRFADQALNHHSRQ